MSSCFSGTIRENIRYGRLEASEEEIIRAAKAVHAHEFIMKMEKGYDTEVKKSAAQDFSAGQKTASRICKNDAVRT